MTEGFLLGLANGGVCLAYCAPVLVPYLLGEGNTVRRSTITVGGFLGGRLVGYLVFAVLAWLTHRAIVDHLPHQRIVIGIVIIGLALLLIAYGFAGWPRTCPGRCGRGVRSGKCVLETPPPAGPARTGLPGLNVCRPFLMAFGNAAQLPELWQTLLFFAAFFVGTSVYLAPLPLVGRPAGTRSSEPLADSPLAWRACSTYTRVS